MSASTDFSGAWQYSKDKAKLQTTFDELKKLWAAHTIDAKTLVWRKGMPMRKELGAVPGLEAAVSGVAGAGAQAKKPEEEEWFYVDKKTASQTGPVTAVQLVSLITSGTVDRGTFGWKEGMADWVALSTIPSLGEVFDTFAPPEDEGDDDGEDADGDGDSSMGMGKAVGGIKAGAGAGAGSGAGAGAGKAGSAAGAKAGGAAAGSGSGSGAGSAAALPPLDTTPVWHYIDKERKQQGPVSTADLVKLYTEFKINDTTLTWKAGLKEWSRFGEIDELAAIIADQQQRAQENKAGAGKKEPVDAKEAAKLAENKKRKREQKKKKAKGKWQETKEHANVYVTGLPPDLSEDEAHAFFKKVGIIKDDPATSKPRIKLYTDESGNRKGDGLVSYLKPESVELAIDLLDGSEIRPGVKVHIQKAEFKMKGAEFVKKQKLDSGKPLVVKGGGKKQDA